MDALYKECGRKLLHYPSTFFPFINSSRCYGPFTLSFALPRLTRNSLVLIPVSEIVLVYVKTKHRLNH